MAAAYPVFAAQSFTEQEMAMDYEHLAPGEAPEKRRLP